MSKRNGFVEEQDLELSVVTDPAQDQLNVQQDPYVRRQTRINLREIINETTRNKAGLITGDVADLEKHLEDENDIIRNVLNPPEMALDARVCCNMADLGKERTKCLMTDMNNFQTTQFTRNVRTTMLRASRTDDDDDDDDDDEGDKATLTRETWVQFGQQCQKYLKRSPVLHFMFGSFPRGPPIKKPAIIKPHLKPSERDNILSVPKQLGSVSEMQKKETTSVEVDKIHHELRKYFRHIRVPMCYYEFVINPESFEQSVENMFYTSFLIKDGYAKLSLDDDRLPVIEPVEREEDSVSKGGNAVRSAGTTLQSVIITLTKENWRNLIKTFNIVKCIIPTREVREISRINRNARPNRS